MDHSKVDPLFRKYMLKLSRNKDGHDTNKKVTELEKTLHKSLRAQDKLQASFSNYARDQTIVVKSLRKEIKDAGVALKAKPKRGAPQVPKPPVPQAAAAGSSDSDSGGSMYGPH